MRGLFLCFSSCPSVLSPKTWIGLQVSSDDADGYKKGLRNQLRQAIDSDRDLLGGAPEFVIACLQPFAADANAKAAKKVHTEHLFYFTKDMKSSCLQKV